MEIENDTILNWKTILELLISAASWAIGVIVSVLIAASAWLAQRRIKYVDDIGGRVASIERNYITREHFDHHAERVEDMLSKLRDLVFDLKTDNSAGNRKGDADKS